MSFTLAPHSQHWRAQFASIRDVLQAQLDGIEGVSIEHVGSTAVAGLSAPAAMDVCIFAAHENIKSVHEALLQIATRDAQDQPFRDCIVFKALNETPPYVIYLCVHASLPARAHLAIRDTLRSDTDVRAEYNEGKTAAANHAPDVETYRTSKTALLQPLLIASCQFSNTELATLFAASAGSRWAGLDTARLTLREYVASDVEAVFALESHAENARFQDWGPWTRRRARQAVLGGIRESFDSGRATVELAVVHEGALVGRVGARVRRSGGAEGEEGGAAGRAHGDLWFSFVPAAQGKGLATEAVRAFVDGLVTRGGYGEGLEMEIECDPRNTRSWKLAERLGFERVRLTERAYESKGEWVGSLVYARKYGV